MFLRFALFISTSIFLLGCGTILRKKLETEQPPIAQNEAEAGYVLEETGKNIIYGESLGDIGAAILIPPYGIYKLGQAAAGLAGYELDAKEALDEDSKKAVEEAYGTVIGIPGRAVAAAADKL